MKNEDMKQKRRPCSKGLCRAFLLAAAIPVAAFAEVRTETAPLRVVIAVCGTSDEMGSASVDEQTRRQCFLDKWRKGEVRVLGDYSVAVGRNVKMTDTRLVHIPTGWSGLDGAMDFERRDLGTLVDVRKADGGGVSVKEAFDYLEGQEDGLGKIDRAKFVRPEVRTVKVESELPSQKGDFVLFGNVLSEEGKEAVFVVVRQ